MTKKKQQQIKQEVMKLTMEFVDKGHDLIKARELAKAKQLNHYVIDNSYSNKAPRIHPCAGR